MKIVKKDTEEIYEFIIGDVISEMVEVDYQQNPYSQKVRQNLPFMNFFNGNIYVPFAGFEFKNWLHQDWPTRIKLTFEQETKIVYDYPEFLESLKTDPINPKNDWNNGQGEIIYVGKVDPISEQERQLILSYGGIIEDYNQI